MRRLRRFFILACLLSLTACDESMRLSSAVKFQRQDPVISSWLKTPQLYFLESYVRFDDTLDKSVIFGIDQEMLEGTKDPIHFAGADWMGLVGAQRDGKIWLATGTDATMKGKPSDDRNWVYLSLGQPLQPNTWYRFHSVVDYSTRRYVSFTVEGEGLQKTFDLSAYTVDYPNMLPFDGRAMTDLVWSIGGKALGGTKESDARVYFDDVRSGIVTRAADGGLMEQTLFREDFEDEADRFADQPWSYMDVIVDKVIPLDRYQDGKWYLERGASLSRPAQVAFAHSGQTVALTDASLEKIKYEDWLERTLSQP